MIWIQGVHVKGPNRLVAEFLKKGTGGTEC